MTIEWNDSYDIGDVQINHQHRRLFVLANHVLRATEKAELLDCVVRLFQYIEEHFAYEEALMRKVNFPMLGEHVQSHQELIARLESLSGQDLADAAYKAALETLVRDWALGHIPHEDAKLAEYLNYGDTRKTDITTL